MRTPGHNPAMIQQKNFIRMHDAGNPLRYDDFRRVSEMSADRLAQPGIRLVVQRAAGIVQQQDFRIVQKSP